jgi:hypothetical protein
VSIDGEERLPVDCHTHIWLGGVHLGGAFVEDATRVWGSALRLEVDPEQHWQAMLPADRVIVLAFQAPACGVVVPNAYVAAYVAQHPDKLIGFASVDPNDPGAADQLRAAVDELGLRGLKVAPIYQDFDPTSERAERVFAVAEELGLPVLWHQGTSFIRSGPLKYSNPVAVDEVAIRHPELRVVVAHLGHPWIEETIVVVRKHPFVYADISGLHTRPWQLYNGLVTALEYGITDKLLFGSDFPFATIQQTRQALRAVTRMVEGTPLPQIPGIVVESIIARNTTSLLRL